MNDIEKQTHQQVQVASNESALRIDEIPTSQPELGPSIPEGGYGWVVFAATLFFQTLIPSIVANFGLFVVFSKLEHGTARETNPTIWDEPLVQVPLLYLILRTLVDPIRRRSSATWLATRSNARGGNSPRLVAISGVCLICAGLLFLWLGMTGSHDDWFLTLAGIATGSGSAVVIVQCELQLAQYFRLRLPVLHTITNVCSTLGFVLTPIIIGRDILETRLSHIILWYQAVVLQGVVVALVFRLPPHLKAKPASYRFLSGHAPDEEEEDSIFSKNAKELQIRRQDGEGGESIRKIAIGEAGAGPSAGWVVFDEEEAKSGVRSDSWVKFEPEQASPRIVNELSLADELQGEPSSLFGDLPVNYNNSYSFDDTVADGNENSSVFVPNRAVTLQERFKRKLVPLKELTFYKSLVTIVANKYSMFVFYALYPSHLYSEVEEYRMPTLARFIGLMALPAVGFFLVAYCLPMGKKTNALFFAVYNCLSFIGYFMISDATYGSVAVWGGFHVSFANFALEFYGKTLFGVSMRGEVTEEYKVLSFVASIALCLFFFIDINHKTCFRMMAIMQFFVACLWLANFIYNKIRVDRAR